MQNKNIILVLLCGAGLVSCSKKMQFDYDVGAGKYQEHVFEHTGKAGMIRGDIELIGLYKDKNKKWLPGFEIGCSDKAARSGFKIVGLAEVKDGELIEGQLKAGVSGVSDNAVLVNEVLVTMVPGNKYHFEFRWNKHFYAAKLNDIERSASGITMPNKKCRLFASTVHVKFSDVSYIKQ